MIVVLVASPPLTPFFVSYDPSLSPIFMRITILGRPSQDSFPQMAGLLRLRKAGVFVRLIPPRFDQLSNPPPGPLFLIGNMQTFENFEYLREYYDLENLGVCLKSRLDTSATNSRRDS